MRRHMMIALALLACGKTRLPGGGGGGPDGGPGQPDATSSGPVSVTVLSFDGLRTPREGIDVGFFAPDGAHDATVATGADGVATSDLDAGGAIVVFEPLPPAIGIGGAARAYAVLAVEPGDQIVVGGEPFVGGETPVTMTVTLPMVTGAIFYEVDTSCGNFSSGTEVVTLNFAVACDPDTFSFLATTSGDSGRVYLREEDVPVIASGNYDAMATWQMIPTRSFLFTDLPDEASNLQVGVYALRSGEDQMDTSLTRDNTAVTEDMATLRPERIPNYDATMVWAEVRPEQAGLGAFDFVRWLGPDDDTDANVGELMLPWMSPISYDSGARALRWQIVGDQEYDATYVNLIANINDGKIFLETVWLIVAPPGIEEIVMPTLPSAKADYFLPDPQFVNSYGQIVESNQLDGYDGARQVGLDPSYFPRHEPLGAVVRTTFSGSIDR